MKRLKRNDGCFCRVVRKLDEGVILQAETGDEAFAYGQVWPLDTILLCTVRQLAQNGYRMRVSVVSAVTA